MSEVNTDLNRPPRPWQYRVLDAVIALVVLLVIAAVLFPLLPRRCEITRKDTCQSNLKECAIALQTYCNDYDGCLPSSALVAHSKRWSERDFLHFASRQGALPPVGRATTWPQLLRKYEYEKGYDIINCPSDSIQHRADAQVSYWWKLAIDRAWYGDGCKKSYRRLDDFAFEPDTMVLYERAGFHCGNVKGLTNGVQINAVYLDTHVRSINIVNSASLRGGKPVTSPLSLGEPMYFNFDNNKPKSSTNPRPPDVAASYVDPGRYSDMLP